MTLIENVILSIVEGITEFLPVSSTGHLIMFQKWLNINDANIDTYIISIQFGAILAVVGLYFKRFFNKNWLAFYTKLLIGFIPAAVLGLLFDDFLETLLGSGDVVGIMLIAVGVLLYFIEDIFKPGTKTVDSMTWKDSLIIGFAQTIAMIPGTSRSAATIGGALGCKLSLKESTEFSFFLAIPTLTAASFYKVFKNWETLSATNISDIALGNVLSFFTALLAVKFFIQMVQKRGFKFFAIYRIIVGSAFLLTLYL